MQDGQLRQSKAITGTSAQFLDDWIDLLAAKNLGGGMNPIYPQCRFTAAGGTTPTALVEFGVADDTSGTNFTPLSRNTSGAAVSINGATAGAPVNIGMTPVASWPTKRRYAGWRVTLAGTSPTGTIDVDLNLVQQTAGPTPFL